MSCKKITESEIHSLIRNFLKCNNFNLITKTKGGEPLHYLNELTKRPRYKIPDHVAIKDDYILVLEDKIIYSDLFGSEKADINKLSNFFYNETAIMKFKKLLQDLEIKINQPKIVCGFASLCPQKNAKKIPKEFLFLSIEINDVGFEVSVAQCPKHLNLFEKNTVRLSLS